MPRPIRALKQRLREGADFGRREKLDILPTE
jgi:hypothetical protein